MSDEELVRGLSAAHHHPAGEEHLAGFAAMYPALRAGAEAMTELLGTDDTPPAARFTALPHEP